MRQNTKQWASTWKSSSTCTSFVETCEQWGKPVSKDLTRGDNYIITCTYIEIYLLHWAIIWDHPLERCLTCAPSNTVVEISLGWKLWGRSSGLWTNCPWLFCPQSSTSPVSGDGEEMSYILSWRVALKVMTLSKGHESCTRCERSK